MEKGPFTSHCSRKDPSRICRPDSRTQEVSEKYESVSVIIISSKDTLTAKNGDVLLLKT